MPQNAPWEYDAPVSAGAAPWENDTPVEAANSQQRGNVVSRQFEKLANVTLPKIEGSTPVSEVFEEAAQSSYTPSGDTLIDKGIRGVARAGQFVTERGLGQRIAEPAIRTIGAIGQAVAEDPYKAIIEPALTAPARTAAGINDANSALMRGDFPEAGRQGLNAAQAGMETALLVAPGTGAVARTSGGLAARQAPQLLDDAARAGVDVTAPMAFPRTAGAASKQLAENIPAGVTTRAGADKSLRQIEGAVNRMADEYSSGASSVDAGAAAREGAARFNSRSMITPDESVTLRQPARFSTFRDKAEAVYSRAYRGFDANAQSVPRKTLETLSSVNARFSNAELQSLFELPTAKKLQGILASQTPGAGRSAADDLYRRVIAVKSQERAQSGISLADFVRQKGGVRDVGGDVMNAIGNTARGRPGLVSKNGKQVDDLIIEAVEDGYFPEANLDQGIIPSQREFLDALTDDVQGRRRFAQADSQALYDNQSIDRLSDELSRMGVDINAPRDELIQQIEQAAGAKISSRQLSIADMRALRTEIREIQNGSRILKTRDDAALERLEGALTEDIYNAVEAAGGKSALQNLKRADRYYRLGSQRIKKALEPFLKDGATDESAARTILNAAQGKPGRGDIQRLRALRRSLRPDEMDDISSGVLREMGQPKPGSDWSPETFANNWNSLGDESKSVLFDRAQRPEARQNLDALARVIDRQRNVEALSNRSRSGANAQNFGTAVAFLAEPVTTTFAVLGANAGGRLLMSPSFTKALLQLERNIPRATRTGANVTAEKARALAIIGAAEQSDASIKPYTAQLKKTLKEAENDNQPVYQPANQTQP